MGRKSAESPETVMVSFRKRQHFWFDAGLVGLYLMAEKTGDASNRNVQITHDARSLCFSGTVQNVQRALEEAYDVLVDKYYSVSTQKQKDAKAGYYYDSKSKCVVRFPKRKAQGIVLLIFNKAVRPSADQIPWKDLPDWNSDAHDIVSSFLKEQNLKPDPPAGLLVNGPNRLKPGQVVAVPEGKKRGTCFLCGEASSSLKEADQLAYPMITGTSGILSFNSEGSKKPPRICWKCSYVSKFVPAGGFYLRSDDRLHCFFPYSNDLRVMLDSHQLIHDIEEEDPNYFRNFTPKPSGYLNHANEVAFSFLFTLYDKARARLAAEMAANQDPELAEFFPMKEFLSGTSPLEFYRLHGKLMGQTVRVKKITKFYDTSAWFRFFSQLATTSEKDQSFAEKNSEVPERGLVEKLYAQLLERDAKKEAISLMRDRFLGRVLEKTSVLDLAESHAFHVNRRTKPVNISAIAGFVTLYEPMVRKERSMTDTERQAAVSLGKRIGSVVAAEKDGRKGDLFSLRKARTVAGFLAELNRLQFRYPLAVPPETYEGALRHDTFDEFRGFCMVAALNTFNAKMTSKKNGKESQS
jgi:hypothetical protein